MDKLRNMMMVMWIICLALLGIIAHLAGEDIEAQMIEEKSQRKTGGR